MHVGRHYKIKEVFLWTRRNIYRLFFISAIPVVLYEIVGCGWLAIPWVPVALLGTATAFIAGFRNNATYARAWEARQIWGGIINVSRTWGIMVRDYIRPESESEARRVHQQLFYRHIAWLTALRFQLRESKTWENIKTKDYNAEYARNNYKVYEWEHSLAEELKPFLSEEERTYVLGKKNVATQIISLQSKQLKELSENQDVDGLRYVELGNLLKDFYDLQGRSERIKNFPYPRQFATFNLFFINLFIFMVPFGMLKEFEKLGEHAVWLTIPFSMIVSWVFTTLEQIGESTENPFEGGPNDIPITSITRTIEIDLRDMLDETNLPAPITAVNNIVT